MRNAIWRVFNKPVARAIRYVVNAPPELVLQALASSMSPGNWIGLYLGDRARGKFIGDISPSSEFSMRVARGLFSNYSGYTWLRGSVQARDVRAIVIARFRPHPLMQVGSGVGLVLFVLLGAALVLASLRQAAFLGALPLLLIIPLSLFFVGRSVRRDRNLLRQHLEAVLGSFGSLRTEPGD
jgi:hypothetical protein